MKDFTLIYTEDGSPSLRWQNTNEPMHNLKGALSESLEIYGKPMEEVRQTTGQLTVLSIGLGLGYNEMIFSTITHQMAPDTYTIVSCEISTELKENFKSWLERTSSTTTVYDEIIGLIATKLARDPSEVGRALKKNWTENRIALVPALDEKTQFSQKFNCILYDPFCSHSNPELWEQEFLEKFLDKSCAPQCLLSTYAAKGTLKRALKNHGFEIQLLEGFSGKRNRIIARRKM